MGLSGSFSLSQKKDKLSRFNDDVEIFIWPSGKGHTSSCSYEWLPWPYFLERFSK